MAQQVRVAPLHALVHYLVCDKHGARATLEFLDGALVTASGGALATPVLANTRYSESAAALAELDHAKATPPIGDGSLARFLRAADLRRAPFVTTTTARAFESLTYDQRAIKDLDLARLDFSCTHPVRALDLCGWASKMADLRARFARISGAGA